MMKNLSEIEPSFKYDLKIDLTELRERIKIFKKLGNIIQSALD